MSKPAFPFDPTYPSTDTRPGLPESTTGKWYPYRSAGDFDANLAMILVILLCALMCALALNAIIRCFFKWSRRRASLDRLPETSPGKLAYQVPAVLPTLIYSSGMKLAGAEAECAICLSEFVNGESVRVLPRCKHGFHVRCIEGWLVGHSSCPTCRASCQPNPSEKISGSASVAVSAAVENSPETLPQGSSVP